MPKNTKNHKERIAVITSKLGAFTQDSRDLAVILSRLPKGVAKQLYKDAEVSEILKRHGIEGVTE